MKIVDNIKISEYSNVKVTIEGEAVYIDEMIEIFRHIDKKFPVGSLGPL
jgi:hypothetical protein